MTAPATSPTVSAIYAKLRAFLQTYILPVGVEVVRGLGNRVPTPAGSYVCMTALYQQQLRTNLQGYDGLDKTVEQGRRIDVQLDFYGPLSADWAAGASMLLRDPIGCDALAPTCSPLYADEGRQIPTVTGEEQYQQRWMVTAVLQFNVMATLVQESATALDVDLINVDVEYTP